ncbi:hypothetical protein [Thermostaphylospora chromogena]|uniref:Uncharacterized protein n=1 Tax=Thermostaphylospora chromogena TaxID=35622 RepID=A0A1H1HE53_9ACTN|nr:hypothetical protein [Thermostaphylospora chromogena]SDR05465.1 hypothetical protein SAMN04489764_3235 [Thermostaphylospora chromogena]SDR23724.1 hypothetical protein SAMN04489764_4338 [Thermostaphylospora chromogena]
MTTILDIPPSDLAAALRRWARGTYTIEAATELLIRHRYWPARAEFRRLAIEYVTDTYDGEPLAVIGWQAAHTALNRGRLAYSSSEAAVLRLAVSLAESIPVNLGEAISELDTANLGRVCAAIRHAGGDRSAWPQSEGSTSRLADTEGR